MERSGHALPFAYVIVKDQATCGRRQRRPGFDDLLLGRFVLIDHRALEIKATGIYPQRVFPVADKIGTGRRRYASWALQPRLEIVGPQRLMHRFVADQGRDLQFDQPGGQQG